TPLHRAATSSTAASAASATSAASANSAASAASAPSATATASSASTAAVDTSTPATTSTTTPTPSTATTTTSTAPASPTSALAPLAPAGAASPARGRRSSDRLETTKVSRSSRGNRGQEGGGGTPLKDGGARVTTRGSYSNYARLCCKEALLEEVNELSRKRSAVASVTSAHVRNEISDCGKGSKVREQEQLEVIDPDLKVNGTALSIKGRCSSGPTAGRLGNSGGYAARRLGRLGCSGGSGGSAARVARVLGGSVAGRRGCQAARLLGCSAARRLRGGAAQTQLLEVKIEKRESVCPIALREEAHQSEEVGPGHVGSCSGGAAAGRLGCSGGSGGSAVGRLGRLGCWAARVAGLRGCSAIRWFDRLAAVLLGGSAAQLPGGDGAVKGREQGRVGAARGPRVRI
ncbi:unnamed protein product, partial [Closterium sp. NIES-53]